jgi:putative transposase
LGWFLPSSQKRRPPEGGRYNTVAIAVATELGCFFAFVVEKRPLRNRCACLRDASWMGFCLCSGRLQAAVFCFACLNTLPGGIFPRNAVSAQKYSPASHALSRPELVFRNAVLREPQASVLRSRIAIRLIEQIRQHSRSHGFAVHAYCVMPDHLHALVFGLGLSSDLLTFVTSLKQKAAYEFYGRFHRILWQKKFYDHILRAKESPERVAAYIWMNPIRKGLCKDVRDYPHSGSFTFDWKKAALPVQPWVPSWKAKTPA